MCNSVSFNSKVPVIKESNLNHNVKVSNISTETIKKTQNEINTNDTTSFQELKQPVFDPEKSNIKFSSKEDANEPSKPNAFAAILSFLILLASNDSSPEAFAVTQNKISELAEYKNKHGIPSENIEKENEAERFKKMSQTNKTTI